MLFANIPLLPLLKPSAPIMEKSLILLSAIITVCSAQFAISNSPCPTNIQGKANFNSAQVCMDTYIYLTNFNNFGSESDPIVMPAIGFIILVLFLPLVMRYALLSFQG